MNNDQTSLTLPYYTIGNITLLCDVHLSTSSGEPSPVIIHWHGGGLTSGARHQYLPQWLVQPTLAAHGIFVTPDYRLLSPTNGHDLVEDVKAIVQFVANGGLSSALSRAGHAQIIDSSRIILGGQSAGAVLAALAILHCPEIRFLCLITEYGCGGENFTPRKLAEHNALRTFFTNPKTHPAIPEDDPLMVGWATPFHLNQPVETESSSAYDAVTGRPTKARMMLMRYYLQRETFLDVYTGENGLQESIKSGGDLPEAHRLLFPMLSTGEELSLWPPTVMLHGDDDTVVLLSDSLALQQHLNSHDVRAETIIVKGGQHGGDVFPNSDPMISKSWEVATSKAVAFLQSYLE